MGAGFEDDPAWYRNAIFYSLPVRAFFDANNDGIGDFPGLTRKLDYLTELGVTAVWLLPFYPSPLRDDGYDVADYRAIHPDYGTIRDFQYFVQAAHERGIRVAAEMVIHHTSNEHPWFQAARSAPAGSPLRDFYLWSDTDAIHRETDVHLGDVKPSNWTWDPVAGAYYWHRFFASEPDLHYGNAEVRAEMLRVLRFWLDNGVDGLCLNGVSYLFEDEGTRGQHLPQTHAFLKTIRREVDAAYPDRMIQAGVNGWPAEVLPYFGRRDECHMAPNLPLAQQLFLAIAQEDRHPVTEIVRQMPDLPDACQWVTLLRNHDELTLHLATDDERESMYEHFASDTRMRLHHGIRRRLAPLVDRDRRRIELLFGLLFSLPGAPMLYYGDEIGMGDNVYLAGRRAVRTPMQWSADRNAGFSAADFAHLDTPPLMDSLYGYQVVNVEAQKRDPSSLFHWVRRLIALRKHTPSLARGRVELLTPANRKVLAYVRRDGNETILVVANLSRALQPVELELKSFGGLIPVELAGGAALPRIADTPYFLTLAPYACHWFRLQKAATEVAVRRLPTATEDIETVPTIDVDGPWEAMLTGSAAHTLMEKVLPGFLRAQRWFGGKASRVDAVRLADWGRLPSEFERAYLALFEVGFAGGRRDLYFLPFGIMSDPDAGFLEERKPWIIARLRGPQGQAIVYDLLANDGLCRALLQAIGSGQEVALANGRVRALATDAYTRVRGHREPLLTVKRGAATSSNSLVLYGRRLLLKLFRRLQEGVNPDFEIGRYLTEREHFTRTPAVAGALEYQVANSPPITLAIVQALVANQGDGWQHAIDELGRYYERASGRMFAPDPTLPDERSLVELSHAVPPLGALETIGSYLHAAATLGRRTAEMHLALSEDMSDPAFAPEPFTAADALQLRDAVVNDGWKAMALLKENHHRLPAGIVPSANQFLDDAPAVLKRLSQAAPADTRAHKIRCHGDYHLGQVLWVDNDYIILDFEGEPTRNIEERRAKQSPLKDVAGMLRSYHYAAYAGLFDFTQNRGEDFDRLQPWAVVWFQWIGASFLQAYRATAGQASFLPSDETGFATLLEAFMLDKAFYELAYELNSRPDWVRIPLSGILALLSQETIMQEQHTPDAPATERIRP